MDPTTWDDTVRPKRASHCLATSGSRALVCSFATVNRKLVVAIRVTFPDACSAAVTSMVNAAGASLCCGVPENWRRAGSKVNQRGRWTRPPPASSTAAE